MCKHKNNFKLNQRSFIYCIFCVTLSISAPIQSVIAAPAELGIADLSASDISYLWPVPTSATEVDKLLDATTVVGKTSIWPEESFNAVIDMALNKVVAENSFGDKKRIAFNTNALNQRETWKVVGFRVDPSAPSTNPVVISSFGSIPQIRLIMQPITMNTNRIIVHDFTAHLPFNYTLNAKMPFEPNKMAFTEILNDLVALKSFLLQASTAVSTDGLLRVNPGLASDVPNFAAKVEGFLAKHLDKGVVTTVAFMGLAPRPEPWVFFSTNLVSPKTTAPNSQILFMMDTSRPASPPIGGPNKNLGGGAGVSTAVLFQPGASNKLMQPAIPNRLSPLVNEIPNIIANPEMSNVLNTDCVSCHSETTRRSILDIDNVTGFQYSAISGVDPALLPTRAWNVRNFGWFTPDIMTPTRPTITMRTSNETADALKFIRTHY